MSALFDRQVAAYREMEDGPPATYRYVPNKESEPLIDVLSNMHDDLLNFIDTFCGAAEKQVEEGGISERQAANLISRIKRFEAHMDKGAELFPLTIGPSRT